jgi:hypothetical protein
VVFGLGITTNAFSATTHSGWSKIDWSNYDVEYGDGITGISWIIGGQFDNTHATATANGVGPIVDENKINFWGVVSSMAFADGGSSTGTANSWTNANEVGASYSGWSTSGGNEENGTAARYGAFFVSGTGHITFSVPYSLYYVMNVDSTGWARTASGAGIGLGLYGDDPLDVVSDSIGEYHAGEYFNEVSKQDILSLTFFFNSGDIGVFGAGVGDPDILYEWGYAAAPVPLPSAILLLAPGLAGIAFLRRKIG